MFMERAVLKKVVLENFMCYAHAEFDFMPLQRLRLRMARVSQLLPQLICGACLTVIMN